MSNIDYEKNENYYNEIVDNCHKNDEVFEMWQDLFKKAIEYTSIRAKWSLMSIAEKIEKDTHRTACHDSFINSLKIKGTELNIAILVTLLSGVPFMTIINPVLFITNVECHEHDHDEGHNCGHGGCGHY